MGNNIQIASERNRSLLKKALVIVSLWLLVMVSGLSLVYTTETSRGLQNELETMRRQTNELHVEWSKYLLEYSTWAEYGNVQQAAGGKLNMEIPSKEKIVVIER